MAVIHLSVPEERFCYRPELAQAATPRSLGALPRHRWFYFPHSFAPGLVEAVLDLWQLPSGARILDPFVGAGTTLVVARERGFHATGLDISPLAVLASNVKVRDYDPEELREALRVVLRQARMASGPAGLLPLRLRRAFSAAELTNIIALRNAIVTQPASICEFMMLALLWTTRQFSRAAADGGWFRWVEKPCQSHCIIPAFTQQVEQMISDAETTLLDMRPCDIRAILGDSRMLCDDQFSFDGVITSPPYANRHDYTRVFQIELLLLGASEAHIFELRRRSLRSHVEARGNGLQSSSYEAPSLLKELLGHWPSSADSRIPRMLSGYFEDLYCTLTQINRVLAKGGSVAFVLGNVRHAGVLVPVDEIFATLAEQTGMAHVATWVIRERGNSAQQMGKFGRVPARESVILLRKQ